MVKFNYWLAIFAGVFTLIFALVYFIITKEKTDILILYMITLVFLQIVFDKLSIQIVFDKE